MNNTLIKRYIAIIKPFNTKLIHYRNPFVVAWWSAAFPGFGHLMLSKYATAALLIVWEVSLNTFCHLNEAIFLSLIGNVQLAKEVLNPHWLLLYVLMYVFTIGDSYRLCVENNIYYTLARKDGIPHIIENSSSVEFQVMDKKSPRQGLLWSLACPGLGCLFQTRLVSALIILSLWLFITYQVNLYGILYVTLLGDFDPASKNISPQWLLFLPSIYCFAAYDTFVNVTEMNKFLNKLIAQELKEKYQVKSFKMPF